MTIYESKVQMLKIAEDFNFGKFSKYVEFNPLRNNEQTYFPLFIYLFIYLLNSFIPCGKLVLGFNVPRSSYSGSAYDGD